jgi:hypothetical protein
MLVSLWLATIVGAALAPAGALAAEPVFGTPTATAELGSPPVFTSTITGDDVDSVEVLIRLKGDSTTVIVQAHETSNNTWVEDQALDIGLSAGCECILEGDTAPNTRFEYQFRVTAHDGSTTLGPVGEGIVEDTRFEWRELSRDLVNVHWYAGDDTFAGAAADLGNEAIDRASELLATTLPGPVDLFVYDTQQALLEAVSPNRENIAGESHQDILTMFVWIPHDQGADVASFAGEVVKHELTHLVFGRAVDNPYHSPALWINEGIAVYLSAGYDDYYTSFVDGAVASRSLIPLDGLTGIFPSNTDGFYLAYGESVAAIDYFIRTYGEEKLWALVRSYADGRTDDEAFTAATGGGMAAFNAAWFQSLGLEVREPLGPNPGQPGPIPPGWQVAGGTPVPTFATARPVVTPAPGQPGSGNGGDGVSTAVTVLLWVIVIVAVTLLIGYVITQRVTRR